MIAALGMFSLRDALARQHAATKAGTLALGAILLGTAFLGGSGGWWWRIGVVLPLLFATLPVASHMLARAAVREAFPPEEVEAVPEVEPGSARTV